HLPPRPREEYDQATQKPNWRRQYAAHAYKQPCTTNRHLAFRLPDTSHYCEHWRWHHEFSHQRHCIRKCHHQEERRDYPSPSEDLDDPHHQRDTPHGHESERPQIRLGRGSFRQESLVRDRIQPGERRGHPEEGEERTVSGEEPWPSFPSKEHRS